LTFYSKQRYEDQYDGHILKAERKQQYIMFPAPIDFLNDELKSELGMKTKKEEEEDDGAMLLFFVYEGRWLLGGKNGK
jgi:hypothetical protein